jgi:hypothetical protein
VFHWIMILKNKKRFTLQSPKKRFNVSRKNMNLKHFDVNLEPYQTGP